MINWEGSESSKDKLLEMKLGDEGHHFNTHQQPK